MEQKTVEVVMGISGSGKSTIGAALAKSLAIPFLDADDFHPRENVMKMSRGLPLDDDDRWPWLASIVEYIRNHHRNHFVLACSALKASYREFLNQSIQCRFHHLDISEKDAIDRMNERQGHFMKSDMVKSQLATLEVTEDLNLVAAKLSQEQIIDHINQNLK